MKFPHEVELNPKTLPAAERAAALLIETMRLTLNDMLEADPEAAREMVGKHFECTKELVDHPTIQVLEVTDGKFTISLMGVLNGMVQRLNQKYALAVAIDEAGVPLKFYAARRWW